MKDLRQKAGLICTRPFEWLEIHRDGHAFLCCPAWVKRPIGNLLEQPLMELWNSPRARETRKACSNGSFHLCSARRCPWLASGLPPVQRRDKVREPAVREAVARGRDRLEFGPRRLNLCHDHSCNLACPSCRGAVHFARGEERRQIERLTEKIVAEAGPWAEELTLSGTGDPFASPHFRDFLRSFPRESFPRLTSLRLHSNGQLWSEPLWAEMGAIHPFVQEVEISVDACVPGTYALNRPGGDWRTLLKNLAFIATLPATGKLSFVVQQNNWREIPAFVALSRRLGFSAYFSQLVNWGTFSREEFRRRAVHLPEHAEHSAFRRLLNRVGRAGDVDFGNLHALIENN